MYKKTGAWLFPHLYRWDYQPPGQKHVCHVLWDVAIVIAIPRKKDSSSMRPQHPHNTTTGTVLTYILNPTHISITTTIVSHTPLTDLARCLKSSRKRKQLPAELTYSYNWKNFSLAQLAHIQMCLVRPTQAQRMSINHWVLFCSTLHTPPVTIIIWHALLPIHRTQTIKHSNHQKNPPSWDVTNRRRPQSLINAVYPLSSL